MSQARAILLMGATATGKTELALAIAERFDSEIVSVDSALIYRGMNIGTAKPAPEVLASVPHHLVDIIDPAESWSVWDFVEQSRQLVAEINARGRIALLAGGTMMYFNAFEQGLNPLPAADPALRERLDRDAREIGLAALHRRLAEVDPASAARIRESDPQRLQRALEVYEISGKPLSQLQQQQTSGFDGRLEKIILAASDRAELHRRIALRFDAMLAAGFIAEVEGLRHRGDLNPSMPSMRCVGYRQAWQYLDGDYDRAAMIDRAVAATRQLAKRQITWLRKQRAATVHDCLDYSKDDIFRQVEAAFNAL